MTRSNLPGADLPEHKCFEQESRVLDLMPFPVIAVMKSGQVFFANHKAQELLGSTVVIGNLFQFLAFGKDIHESISSIQELEDLAVEFTTLSMRRLSDQALFDVELILRNLHYADCEELILLTINDVSQYKIRERELARMANSDELTGIANRRSFLQAFRSEAERAKRYKKNLSLVLLDLDFFKQINDQYGHAVGDEVLKHFAAQAKKVLREIDILGRVGGEEFAILMPETDMRSAKRVAERLRKHIANTQVETERGLLSITFSAGVVAALAGTAEIEGMMIRADDALYEAKHAGRNNVKASVYPYMQQQHLPLSQKAAC